MPALQFPFLFGALANWLAFAATLAVGLFLTPYLIHALGTARYGVWCVAEAVLAYFTLLDMGLAACLVRHVAKHRAAGDWAALNRMASACLALFLAAGAIALLVGVPVSVWMAPSLEAKLGGTGEVLPFLLLMLANLAATLPLSVFPGILDGLEAYPIKSLIRIVMLAVRTVAVVFTVDAGGGLLGLGVVLTATNLLEHLAFAVVCRMKLRALRFSHRFVDRATLKDVRTYSVHAFLAMIAGRITVQTGVVVIGMLLTGELVTFFATAARLVDYAKTLLRTITATLTPGVAAMDGRGDRAGIARLMLAATRWVLYAALPIQFGLMLFGPAFLARWVGPEFVVGSYPALLWMSATLAIGVAQSVTSRILYGLGSLKWFARAALGEAALNLILLAILTRSHCVVGVAIAVSVPNLLFCAFVIGFTRKQLNVTWRSYLGSWFRPMLLQLVPLSIWFAFGEPAANWRSILGHGFAGMMPYVLAVAMSEGVFRRVYSKFSNKIDPRRISVAPSSTATA